MVNEEEIKQAALDYANNQKDIPIKNEFTKYLCIALGRSFMDGAKWAVQQMMKNIWKPADGDDLPEYEREVIVFTQNYPNDAGMMMVAIGHRPTPEGFDGKSLTTGEVEHYTPKTYDKGGWNIPDVKYWLDCELPIKEED